MYAAYCRHSEHKPHMERTQTEYWPMRTRWVCPHWLDRVDIHEQTASCDEDDDDGHGGVGLENSSLHHLSPNLIHLRRAVGVKKSVVVRGTSMTVIKLLFAASPGVIAGSCQRAIKGLSVYGVSSENLFSDDPLAQSQNRFFFEEQADLKTSYGGLCLSVFKEQWDLENTPVFHSQQKSQQTAYSSEQACCKKKKT